MTGLLGDRPGLAVALVDDGYSELGFWYPVLRLRELGAEVFIAGPSGEQTYYSRLGYPVIPDGDLGAARVQEPDVVIVPGDEAGRRLATHGQFQGLVRARAGRGPLVAVIGDPGGLEADVTCPSPDDLPTLIPALLRALRRP